MRLFSPYNETLLVEPLYLNGNSLAFASSQAPDEAKRSLSIRDREGRQAEVQVSHWRKADDKTWICFAELLEGVLEPDWSAQGYQWRRSPRYPVGLRVRSSALPGYCALTHDLSGQGAQLQLEAPVSAGEELELALDLDAGFPELRVRARVCWSRMLAPWRCGVAFLEFFDDGKAQLEQYLGQRYGVSRQAIASDSQLDMELAVLNEPAYLHSSFEEGNRLVLKLITAEQVIEARFESPRLVFSDFSSRMVSVIAIDPQPGSSARTLLVDPSGKTLLELEGSRPDITCREARLHDLE